MDDATQDAKASDIKPTNPVTQHLDAVQEKAGAASDALTQAADKGTEAITKGIDTFVEKQDKLFNVLDNFLKKF